MGHLTDHVKGWVDAREVSLLDHVLFVYFEDMKKDLGGRAAGRRLPRSRPC
ncbi:MAG: sulfotransferase domain-containing protein [Gemmatimonadetes bacterium]|nr:sulfotransferase domain-containing protein [Gemmatimonadota bacterium]